MRIKRPNKSKKRYAKVNIYLTHALEEVESRVSFVRFYAHAAEGDSFWSFWQIKKNQIRQIIDR